MDMILNLDGSILLWIQENLRGDFLNPLITLITTLGNGGLIWLVSSAVMLCFPKSRKTGVLVLMALLASLLVNNFILKNVVARSRPWTCVEGLQTLVEKPKDYSFPSGHTASSFAAAIVMYKTLPARVGVPAVILAVGISLSRLYVGVHYPTDVLAGALSGIIIALTVCGFAAGKSRSR